MQPDLPGDLPDSFDLRLVVCDMDGTLLDADGEVPAGLWPMLERLASRGIVFSPASGRQYATLHRMFARAPEGMVFIAENGAVVMRDGVEVSSTTLPVGLADEVVRHLRAVAADGLDLGVVLCGPRTAYVERTDRAFLDHVDPYYASLVEVEDLLDLDEPLVKVAVYTPGDPETTTGPALQRFTAEHQVVVSGAHWVDLMPSGVHKGLAVRRLQAELGIGAAQTVAFGDYLNDLEMLAEAEWSFAMAEAHAEVREQARFGAPSHRDHGVLTVLDRLLAG